MAPCDLTTSGASCFDIDGTLVHRAGEDDARAARARVEVLERIRASGRPLALFTNGSHAPPEAFAAELRAVGLDVATTSC